MSQMPGDCPGGGMGGFGIDWYIIAIREIANFSPKKKIMASTGFNYNCDDHIFISSVFPHAVQNHSVHSRI